MATLQDVQIVVSESMDDILRCFKPGRKIAVVVWHPDHPTQDFVMTNGPLPDAIAALQRQHERAGSE